MPPRATVLEIRGLRKDFRGRRPLVVDGLVVRERDCVAVSGFDELESEILVNLVTGASLPDEGEIRVFGESTSSIDTAARWLPFLDRFGLVSERAALIDVISIEQNIAVPLTLELLPVADAVRDRVRALAREVGLDETKLARQPRESDGETRARSRLARALALDPSLLLLDHPTSSLGPGSAAALGAIVARVCRARGISAVAVTEDRSFAKALAGRTLAVDLTTGAVRETRHRLRWLCGPRDSS